MNISTFTNIYYRDNNYLNYQKQIIFWEILFDMVLCHFHGGCPTYGQLCLSYHACFPKGLHPSPPSSDSIAGHCRHAVRNVMTTQDEQRIYHSQA